MDRNKELLHEALALLVLEGIFDTTKQARQNIVNRLKRRKNVNRTGFKVRK